MLLSCLISRIIGVVEHIDKKFDGKYEDDICEKALAGVFSVHIYKFFEQLSEESCLCFANKVMLKKDIWDTCLSRLPKGENNGDKDECLNELLTEFGEMRRKYESSHAAEDKKVSCNDLYKKYSGKYSRNVIQAAQIECCDVGIITYGFEYMKAVGIRAKYGIGERSSLLFSSKFKDIIHQYFIANSEDRRLNGTLDNKRKRKNLNEVLQRAGFDEKKKNEFWSCIQNNVNNLYDHYLN